MDDSLTVANLNTQLEVLVDWEIFAINLPGIEYNHIEKMKQDEWTIKRQKLALYSKWLSVCPNPSWRDVAIALEKAKEIALAERIGFLIAKKINANEESLERNKIILSLKNDEEETVITTLKELHLSFTRIFGTAKIEIEKLIKFNKKTLEDCLSLIKAALVHISISGLKSCTTISEIFDILRERTNFMDGSLLKGVIEHVIGQSRLLQDINEHIQKANEFKSSSLIEALKNILQKFDAVKNQTKVIIQINQSWGEFYVGLVETLIKELLKIERGELPWLTVEPGSVQKPTTIQTDTETTDVGVQFNCDTFKIAPQTTDVGIQFNYAALERDHIQNVTISQSKLFTVHGDQQHSFIWDGYGFELHVPKGACPPKQECDILVDVAVDGDFVFPKGVEPVSAIYIISIASKLHQSSLLKLQHCVDLTGCTQLCFYRALLNEPTPPYHFKPVKEKGVFNIDGTQYGQLQLPVFCMWYGHWSY